MAELLGIIKKLYRTDSIFSLAREMVRNLVTIIFIGICLYFIENKFGFIPGYYYIILLLCIGLIAYFGTSLLWSRLRHMSASFDTNTIDTLKDSPFKALVYDKKGMAMEGVWHAYHFTRKGDKMILKNEQWKIEKNWRNRLIIETSDPENSLLKYKGYISRSQNNLFISLKGVLHEDEVQMRFPNITACQDISLGITMGVDFNGNPQSVVEIISRKELEREEVEKILRSRTCIDGIQRISQHAQSNIDSTLRQRYI